jgi:nicotinamidase/pyrazinamidase
MRETITPGDDDVLIVVDIQNDFCPGGALAVPRGDEVVTIVNRLGGMFRHVVLTQDWHPRGHFSFASAHPGKNAYDTIAAFYGPQVLWPDHCVQETSGAALHSALQIPHASLVVRKGHDPAIDSYSAFYENDRKTPTGLAGYLRERGIRRIFRSASAASRPPISVPKPMVNVNDGRPAGTIYRRHLLQIAQLWREISGNAAAAVQWKSVQRTIFS